MLNVETLIHSISKPCRYPNRTGPNTPAVSVLPFQMGIDSLNIQSDILKSGCLSLMKRKFQSDIPAVLMPFILYPIRSIGLFIDIIFKIIDIYRKDIFGVNRYVFSLKGVSSILPRLLSTSGDCMRVIGRLTLMDLLLQLINKFIIPMNRISKHILLCFIIFCPPHCSVLPLETYLCGYEDL